MKIPIDWLKQFVKTTQTDQQIADVLTLSGTNIENLDRGILDAEITANRADCLSIVGIAREYAAFTQLNLIDHETPVIQLKAEKVVDIKITNQEICPRYSAYVIKNIESKLLPEEITKRLKDAGFRSVNSLVDITNYIMLETGQPLHAFDLSKISGPMILRLAKKHEKVVTLDSIERDLDDEAIVIENNQQLIDLAGIMGGQFSAINEKTTQILLQAAIFNPKNIRRTSKKNNFSTEASYRYERGVDINNTIMSLNQAALMIKKYLGGEIIQLIDIYPKPVKALKITWNIKQAEHLLGISIEATQATAHLERLGIITKSINTDQLESTIPSWRFDLQNSADIIEEVTRFYPFNDLPRTRLLPQAPKSKNTLYDFLEFLKDQLTTLGLSEIYGYTFVSKEDIDKCQLDVKSAVLVENPLSNKHQYLRPSLLPSILKAIAQNPSFDPIGFFEIGHIFNSNAEIDTLGIIIAGSDHQVKPLSDIVSRWLHEKSPDFKIVTIDPIITLKYKIKKKNVFYFEIPIDQILKIFAESEYAYRPESLPNQYRPIAKFETVKRDLAIIVDKSVDAAHLSQAILDLDDKIKHVAIFDVFEDPKFGLHKTSYAFHIFYQSDENNLTNEAASILHQKVIHELITKFKAIPRI